MTKEFGVPFKIQSGSKDKKPRWPFVFTLTVFKQRPIEKWSFQRDGYPLHFTCFFKCVIPDVMQTESITAMFE